MTFNTLSTLCTFIPTHCKVVSNSHTMEQVVHLFDVVADRLKKWSQKDNNDVLNFRTVYDIAVADLLVEMRNSERADDTTALRTYKL